MPKLGYAKANQRWWIKLRYNSKTDLVILEKATAGSEIRLVELDGHFYIEHPRIPDSADMGEADRLAQVVLAELNGAVQVLCTHFQGIWHESLIELNENGTGRGIVSFGMTIHGTSDLPAIQAFLDGEASPIASMLPVWNTDPDVQETLLYLGGDGNAWANLYKATEVIEESVGGSTQIFDHGWCSRSEWTRFRRTANHQEAIGLFSRHARSRATPPPDPMTIAEAKDFAVGLLRNWIAFKTAETVPLNTTGVMTP